MHSRFGFFTYKYGCKSMLKHSIQFTRPVKESEIIVIYSDYQNIERMLFQKKFLVAFIVLTAVVSNRWFFPIYFNTLAFLIFSYLITLVFFV